MLGRSSCLLGQPSRRSTLELHKRWWIQTLVLNRLLLAASDHEGQGIWRVAPDVLGRPEEESKQHARTCRCMIAKCSAVSRSVVAMHSNNIPNLHIRTRAAGQLCIYICWHDFQLHSAARGLQQ